MSTTRITVLLQLAMAASAATLSAHDVPGAGSQPRAPVVLLHFPTDPESFQADVAPLVGKLIERHGIEEWNTALLASELHRHLGIYSVVGVKMGLRAREVLGVSLDDLRVVSHAGPRPPVSCLTDGLQVATGASLGRGTIDVADDPTEPAALFIHDETQLFLRLKPDVKRRIERDVAEATRDHGELTPEYFAAIRRLSLRYWLELNRDELFTESLQGATLPEGGLE